MRSLVLKFKDRPFAVIGFNMNDREAKDLAALMKQANLPWRSFKWDSAVARQWHPFTPTFYVLNPQGVIRYKWAGGIGPAAMELAVEKDLAKAANSKE